RDSPHDHKHHHGLMFALAVDGVNFWEEHVANKGKELHKGLSDVKAAVHDGASRAGFVQKLDWVGPDSDKPLLIERREIDVLKAKDLGATLVEWRSSLQTPPGKETMTLTGSYYFGLGLRFVESMGGGRFFNADDKPGRVVGGDRRLTPVKWCAYSAKADGKPVTVAVFDHTANLRHPAETYTMTKPFTYLSATLNLSKEPLVVKAGQPLELRYGVALWDGEADKATVERLYQRWLQGALSSSRPKLSDAL
ncbi:MAG: PmoA family protein, partial [Pirellulales bacterium]|nr:PmoA family protein [Pirellulales bacterium]